MVKGVSRQVVVVRSPDRELFDEAIFLVRADADPKGISDDALMREAGRSAGRYVSAGVPSRRREILLRAGYALLGAAVSCAAWCAVLFL